MNKAMCMNWKDQYCKGNFPPVDNINSLQLHQTPSKFTLFSLVTDIF